MRKASRTSAHLPASRAKRAARRRRVYLGEGLTVSLQSADLFIEGEVIDLTPRGMGVAVLEGGDLPRVGERLVIKHTGRAMGGLKHDAVVTHLGEGTFSGKRLSRIGFAFIEGTAKAPASENRRRGERYACSPRFPVIASARSPVFFREWLYFRVHEIGPGGMTLSVPATTSALLPGVTLALSVTLAHIGSFDVNARVVSIREDRTEDDYVLGVYWTNPGTILLRSIAEYLMLGDKALTPDRLRDSGFDVGSIERAVTFDYATCPDEYDDLLDLRLRSHQHEGRLTGRTKAEMASSFDAHSRHVVCRFGEKIVGYVRIIYVGGDPKKSQYVAHGGHEVPKWAWDAGFVEAGAGAVDPEFQKAGIFLPLMQHAARVALQSGYRYMLGACSDDLLDMYRGMGFSLLETRLVSPKPGWEFRSHLICLDLEVLGSDPPEGRSVKAMASVLDFVGLPGFL